MITYFFLRDNYFTIKLTFARKVLSALLFFFNRFSFFSRDTFFFPLRNQFIWYVSQHTFNVLFLAVVLFRCIAWTLLCNLLNSRRKSRTRERGSTMQVNSRELSVIIIIDQHHNIAWTILSIQDWFFFSFTFLHD